MLNDTTISVRGWVGADPLFFHNINEETGEDTRLPAAIVNVGVTARYYSKRNNKWEDEATTWYSVRCYGALAQHVHMTIHRGAPVLVRGRLATKNYVDKNGVNRTDMQIIADSVAIDLNSAVATYTKANKIQACARADCDSASCKGSCKEDISGNASQVDSPLVSTPGVNVFASYGAKKPTTIKKKEAPMDRALAGV